MAVVTVLGRAAERRRDGGRCRPHVKLGGGEKDECTVAGKSIREERKAKIPPGEGNGFC